MSTLSHQREMNCNPAATVAACAIILQWQTYATEYIT